MPRWQPSLGEAVAAGAPWGSRRDGAGAVPDPNLSELLDWIGLNDLGGLHPMMAEAIDQKMPRVVSSSGEWRVARVESATRIHHASYNNLNHTGRVLR